jgi:uncharacterized lipoprotein
MPKNYVFLLLFCWTLIGCSTTWTTSDPLRYTYDDIWDASYQVLNRRYDILRAQEKEGEIETDWQFQRSNFYLRSYRHKIYAKIEPYVAKNEHKSVENESEQAAQAEQKVYVIKIRAPQDENRDIDNPESLATANWLPAGANQDQEQLVLGFIKAVLSAREQNDQKETKASDDALLELPAEQPAWQDR